jgi:hypothetical protein
MIALACHLPALSAKGLHRLSPCRKHPFLSFRHHGRSKKAAKADKDAAAAVFGRTGEIASDDVVPLEEEQLRQVQALQEG